MLTSIINILFIITSTQNIEPPAGCLKNMTVTQGLYRDRIVVEWDKSENASYTVMRSLNKTGEFTMVSQTPETKFEDITVEKGVKYWYKVLPSHKIKTEEAIFITDEEYYLFPEPGFAETEVNKTEEINTEKAASAKPAVSYSGYTSIETYTGVKFNDLMKLKKAKMKTLSGTEEKKVQKKRLDYINQYYMNPIKLTLFLTMSRPYFDKGDLKILADCETFEIKKDLNQVVFYDKNYRYMAVFESKKIIRIISECDQPDLVEILMKNSELFCVSRGKNFIVDKDGITRLVNSFDAVGLSTGYLKNDREWRSRTVMLSTSRSDLKDMIKNASKEE